MPLGQWLKAMCALSAPFWAPGVATLSVPMLPFIAGQASIDPNVPPIGVGSPRRAAISRLPSVNPSTRRSACTVAIKISPEHNISCRIDCLHWITGECQAEAFSAIDRIEEHDDFSPISRSSREPTRVGGLGSGMVISKESNLSGIVNCSGLHIKIGPTNRRRIGNLDVPFIDLVGANDDAAARDATAHDGTEGNLIGIIDIGHRTNGNRTFRPGSRSSQCQARKTFRLPARDRRGQPPL